MLVKLIEFSKFYILFRYFDETFTTEQPLDSLVDRNLNLTENHPELNDFSYQPNLKQLICYFLKLYNFFIMGGGHLDPSIEHQVKAVMA